MPLRRRIQNLLMRLQGLLLAGSPQARRMRPIGLASLSMLQRLQEEDHSLRNYICAILEQRPMLQPIFVPNVHTILNESIAKLDHSGC